MTLVKDPRTGLLFLLVALAVCLGAIIIWVTPWGAYTGSDSVLYLLSAKNLVVKGYLGIIWGQGLVEPLKHFPPLLTFIVAGFYLLGLDLVSAMRLIDAVSMGLLILLAGWLSFRVTRRPSLSIQVCLIAISVPAIFVAYTSAMSEGLFYLCMLTSLLLLLIYLENRKVAYLIGSALLSAAALLARYIGVAVPLACLAGIILLSHTGWKKRLLDAVIFGVVAVGATLPWFIWVFSLKGQVGGRLFGPAMNLGIAFNNFKLAIFDLIWNWMTLYLGVPASYNVQKIAGTAFFVLLAVALFLVYRRFILRPSEDSSRIALARWGVLFGLAAGFYLLFYFFAYAFTLPTPDLVERIAFPVFLNATIAILGLMHLLVTLARSPKFVQILPWAFTLVLMAAYLPNTVSLARDIKSNGGGYTSRAWRQSKLIGAIKDLPAGLPVVTNEFAAVIFLTGRESIRMSESIGIAAKDPGQSYGADPNDLGESVFRQGGALVIFPSLERQLQAIYGKETQSRLEALTQGLSVYKLDGNNDAGIYFYSPVYVP